MQGIIVSTDTEIFAKEPKLVKLFPQPKSTPVQCQKKGPPVFLVITLYLLHFGAFALVHVNGCFFHRCILLLTGIDHQNIYNRLGIPCTVNTAIRVLCRRFTLEKATLSSDFFGFHCFLLSVCVATNRLIQRLKRLE